MGRDAGINVGRLTQKRGGGQAVDLLVPVEADPVVARGAVVSEVVGGAFYGGSADKKQDGGGPKETESCDGRHAVVVVFVCSRKETSVRIFGNSSTWEVDT